MVMTYDEYLKKNKKKKKEEPKVVLGYSNKNNVNNSPKSTTNTQTLIDKYVAEQKAKKDIAPVRTTVTTPKKPAERTWFQAGAFSDGYDFGDVAKTITGTTADVGLGITKGVFNLAEGIVDLGRYGVSGVANVLGAKEYAKDVKKTAQENTTEKWFSPIEKKIDKNSLIGEKGDTISEGLGYVASMIATGGVGGAIGGAVSGGAKAVQIGATLGTTGVTFTSAMGSGMSEAYEGGASDEEAVTYGVISGIAEAGTELIFGGLGKKINAVGLNTGLSSADDMLAKKVSEIFKKQVSKNIAETGIKMGAEGTEEVIAGIIQAFGQKVTYKSEEELMQIINDQELLESFISGAVVSGIAQAPSVVRDTKAGRDYVTGYTQQEQQAIDKVVNERITEQERQGITLTNKEKNAIIEQTTKEFNEFKEKVKEIAPVKDDVRSQDIAPVKQAGQQDAPVNERQQNYVSEAKETDSVYRKNLNEDASKYANNSKRTHEFVNTLSNISEATGENIRLTNNTSEEMVARRNQLIERYAKKKNISVEEATAKLKDTVIDAYNTGDGITINVNSPKALNRLVGHEITHSLEKTNEYSKLEKIAIEYAKTKGEYDSRVEILESLYDGTNANIQNELTSDIVGDYLFTDQEFINNIQKKDRNLFQRIYDEIKHLIKLVTANTKEAKQLEQLKHSFEKAMEEHKSDKTNKVTVQETKTNLATEVESNTQEKEETVQEVEKEETSNVTENVEAETKTEDNAEEYSLSVDNKGRKLTKEQEEFFEDSVVRDENGNLLTMYHGTSSGGYTVFDPYGGRPGLFGQGSYFTADNTVAESYTEKGRGSNKQIYEVYLNITKPIDMDGQANVEEWKQYFSKHISEATFPESGTNEELYRFTLEEFENTDYDRFEVAEIMIETFQKMGYDGITHIGGGRFNQKDDTRHRVYITFDSNQIKEVTNKKPTEDSDIRYSLSDSKGYHYGDLGKARDTNYFSMSNTRRSTGHFGTGTYFVGSKDSNVGSLKEGRQVHEVEFTDYNLFKPRNSTEAEQLHTLLKDINNGELNAFDLEDTEKLFNKSYEELYEAYKSTQTKAEEYKKLDDFTQLETDSLSTVFMKELGYNGIDVRGIEGFDNGTYGSVIYDLDKKSSGNINYSLSTKDNQGRELSPEQQEYFKDSKVRDENGKLLTMYHGATAKFNVFNSKNGLNWVTNSKEYAEQYELSGGEIKELYVNIKNPFDLGDLDTNVLEGINTLVEKLNPNGNERDKFYTRLELNKILEKSEYRTGLPLREESLWVLTNNKAFKTLVEEKGYDGFKATEYGNLTYATFKPNQIKNVDNTNPTDSDDIRYSLSDSKGRELTKEQQNYFKDSKLRDENGNLKVMYHGTPYGGFNVFDMNKFGSRDSGFLGKGFYFTDDPDLAREYSDEDFIDERTDIPGEFGNIEVKEVYLDVKNPYIVPDGIDYGGGMLNDLLGVDRAYQVTNKLKSMGYDGVIYKNGTEVLVFNPNQIKNVTNTNPTSDPDIRYSLSSTGEMVDNQGNKVTLETSETGTHGTLMAIHNLNESKLKGVIELGGFPVPSIAVTNPNLINHNGYGDISVLFDKNTIDPANSKNEVYDRDVYSPTFPKVDYNIKNEDLWKLEKNMYADYKDTISSSVLNRYFDSSNLEDKVDRLGVEGTIEEAKNSNELKYVYQRTIDKNYQPEMKTTPYSNKYSNESLQRFIDDFKNDMELPDFYYHYLNYQDMQLTEQEKTKLKADVRKAILPEIEQKSKESYQGMPSTVHEKYTEAEYIDMYSKMLMKNFDESAFEYQDFIRDASSLYKNGTELKVMDKEATFKKVEQETNQAEYEKWIDATLGKVLRGAEKGIYNGKEIVTDTGRRTFKQTHYSYNLENLVKVLTKGNTKGTANTFGVGFGKIQAVMGEQFKSIEDIKNAENRLAPVEEAKQSAEELVEAIEDDIIRLSEYFNSGYSNYDLAGNLILDYANEKTRNEKSFIKNAKEYGIDEVSSELINKITNDLEALKVIPTYYFEAKPQRAVGLDEVQAVVIPNDVSPEFKQQLQDAGLTYYEYDSSIEGDRQRVINQFDDLKFSLSRTTDDIAPVKDADVFGRDITLQEAIAPLQEQVKELTKAITDLQENIAPASMDLVNEEGHRRLQEMTDEDAPVDEGLFTFLDNEVQVKKKQEIVNEIASDFSIKKTEARELYNKIESIPEPTIEDVRAELEAYREIKFQEEDDYVKSIQDYIRGTRLDISEIKKQIPDYGNKYRMSNMGKGLILGNSGQKIDAFYQELSELYPNEFPATVTAEADQLELISDAMYKEKEFTYTDIIDDDELQILAERIYSDIGNHERYRHAQSGLYFLNKELKNMTPPGEADNDIPVASNTKQTGEIAPVSRKLKQLNPEATVSETPVTEGTKITKSKWRNVVDTTQRLFVNEMVETDNLAKESGNLNIKYTGDMLNSVAGEIEGEIYTAQTDNEGHAIGKSLSELFAPAKEKGLYDAFNDYLEHYSNIDRHAQGKGSKTPLNVSQTLVKAYEKSYPEFKQWGKDVWKYGANVRQNLIDAGIISEEHAEALGTMYPHYVPYMENREMSNYNPDLGEIKPKGVIKRAKGGAKNLLPIEEALTKYTFGYKKAVRQNQFYQEIIKTLGPGVDVGADVRNDAIDFDDTLYKDETGNYLTAYVDGERISTRITDDLYTGLKNDLSKQIKGLEEKYALITEPVQKLSEIRRNLLTSWNPMFIIKNPIMDIQDALFNSKYTKDFIKHYNIPTFIELGKASTETARQFLTLYGSGNVMGEHSSDGTVKKTKGLKWIQKANNVMELAPRYAEFKASLDNGASIQEAMYNAREVTTNFSRGGTITKALNKNGFTFLNVSVQGFDKFIRNFSGENGAKGVAGALLKATLLGVVPALFNDLLFGGDDEDEEYEALPDYIKDNYYLFKTGEGEFIRIPKGRMLSVFGSAGRRTLEFMQGEEDAFEGFLKNANSQVGISNPLDSNILTPLIQAYGSENGEAWFGGDLVPSRLQKKAPEEQYDATTDKMSIWLGDKLGISPYKLNYVLDQYSGGIGDMFLPIITEESTSDVEGLGMVLAPIKDQFTANSTSDNKYAGEIYDLSDKMDKMPEATKETDEYKVQDAYLYSVTSEMGKLYEERRQVQADKDLSKSEKYKKVQAIQKQINDLAKEGMENYQNVSKSDVYAIVGGREFNKYTTDDGTERWGSVFEDVLEDLNSLGMDLDEKSEYFRATSTISTIQDNYKNLLESASDDEQDVLYAERKKEIINVVKEKNLTGEQKAYLYDKYYGNSDVVEAMVNLNVDIDSFLDYEAQNFTADKYANGKTVPNSKKRKVFNYINSMPIEFEQRLVLAKLQYPSYNEYNPTIIEYLNNSEMTYEQVETLLTKMNFKVDENGNIRW